jgi:hypothetical protein
MYLSLHKKFFFFFTEILSFRFSNLVSIRDIPSTLLQKPFLSLFWLPNFANLAGIGWIIAQKELNRHVQDLANLDHVFAVDILLETLDKVPNLKSNSMENIRGFEDETDRQLLLHYLARTWGCGGSNDDVALVPEEKLRNSLFASIDDVVKREWRCEK